MSIDAEKMSLLKQNELLTLDLKGQLLTKQDIKNLYGVLKANNTLLFLDLSANDISPLLLKGLLTVLPRSLQTLNLSKTNLTSDCLFVLSDFIRQSAVLTALDISSNGLGAGDKNAITELGTSLVNSSLHFLSMKECFLDMENIGGFLKALESNSHLVRLDISNNQLDWRAMNAIGNMLKINQTLAVLHLNQNSPPNRRKELYSPLLPFVFNPKTVAKKDTYLPLLRAIHTNAIKLKKLFLEGCQLSKKELALVNCDSVEIIIGFPIERHLEAKASEFSTTPMELDNLTGLAIKPEKEFHPIPLNI